MFPQSNPSLSSFLCTLISPRDMSAEISNSRHPGCSSLDKTGDPLTPKEGLDSPGGPVAKNALANAGDLGWIPGPRRFHVQLRLEVTTLSTHPAILKPSCL